jgi:hypothetical protein
MASPNDYSAKAGDSLTIGLRWANFPSTAIHRFLHLDGNGISRTLHDDGALTAARISSGDNVRVTLPTGIPSGTYNLLAGLSG